MIFANVVLMLVALIALASASIAIATGKGERVRGAFYLVSMLALSLLFALLGATTLALVQLFVCAGQGFLLFHAIGYAQGFFERDPEADRTRPASASHWLLIVLGIGGGVGLAAAIGRPFASLVSTVSTEAATPHALPAFADVARMVLVDYGIPTLMVALLLLAATVAAGFLVRPERE